MTSPTAALDSSIQLAVRNSIGGAALSPAGTVANTLTEKAMNQSTVFDEVMNRAAITDAWVHRGDTAGASLQNPVEAVIDSVIEVLSNAAETVAANSDFGALADQGIDTLGDMSDPIRDPDIEIVDIMDPGGTGDLTEIGASQIGQAETAALEHLTNMNSSGAPPQTMTPAEQNMAPGSQGFSTYQFGNTSTVVDNLTGDSVSSTVHGEGNNQTSTTTVSRPDLPGVAASPTTNTTTVTTQDGSAVTTQSITTPTGMTISVDEVPAAQTEHDVPTVTGSSATVDRNRNSDGDTDSSSGSTGGGSDDCSTSGGGSDEAGECTF